MPCRLPAEWALGAWVRGARGCAITQRLSLSARLPLLGEKTFYSSCSASKGKGGKEPQNASLRGWGADSQALDLQGSVWLCAPRPYSLNGQSQLFPQCLARLVMTIILLQPWVTQHPSQAVTAENVFSKSEKTAGSKARQHNTSWPSCCLSPATSAFLDGDTDKILWVDLPLASSSRLHSLTRGFLTRP